MPWEKSSEALVTTFHAALPDDPRVERRQMFGYPCAFVNGNMFSGLHQSSMVLRLDEPRREDLLARGARTFEPMGRPMREYVVVPPVILEAPAELARWTAYALEYGAGLPPKPSKSRAAAKKPASKKPAPKKAATKKPAGRAARKR
jgi:TfoX/Sxy family transcriptional regulator of competence genes